MAKLYVAHLVTVLSKKVHMVSALANANQVVLGKIKTEEKSHEITAIPELIELLELKKTIVTNDKI